jgi:hypothetical protein
VATGVIREIWEQLLPAVSSQESKNANLPDEEDRIPPRQEQESLSTDEEKPLESTKKSHPSKRKPQKADIASSNPQTGDSAEPEEIVTSEADETAKLETEEAADSIKEITTENEIYWSSFKSSMLSMMLQLMGKLPVQTV